MIVKALECNGCGVIGPHGRESFYLTAQSLRRQAVGWFVDGHRDWCGECGWRGENTWRRDVVILTASHLAAVEKED